jgi:hypothetical protein
MHKLVALTIQRNPVIPNQNAAALKGTVKRCRGCRKMINVLPFLVFTACGIRNCPFCQVKVLPIFLVPKGAVN